MEYVWIVMLAILYLVWLVASIFDLVLSFKSQTDVDFYTAMFIALHLGVLFMHSFSLWASNH